MIIDKAIIDEVSLSLGRCYLSGGFLDKFYTNFKASNSTISPRFNKTDMSKQHKLLKDGLTYLVMSAGGSGFANTEITKIGQRHGMDHLNVHPQLYKFWVDSLVKTIREFDEKFTPDLEKKWRMVLHEGMTAMTEVYEAKKHSA